MEPIQSIDRSLRNLVHNYGALAKLYVQEGPSAYGREIKFLAVGLFLLPLAWILFIGATIAAVSPTTLPYWASIGIWCVLHIAFGTYYLMSAVDNLKVKKSDGSVTPEVVSPLEIDREMRVRGLVP